MSMAAVAASFLAWSFPSFGVLRKGFDSPSRLDFGTFAVLAAWYLLIFLSFGVGEMAGALRLRKSTLHSRLLDLHSNMIYYAFTVLSALGVGATLISVFRSLTLQQAAAAIVLGSANDLRNALYEDYSIGFASLRYVVVLSGSIALYKVIRFRQFAVLNLLNILLMLMGVVISSRLMFIATLVTLVFLLSFDKPSLRVSIPKLVFIAALIFLILAVLNYSRNKGFYERNKQSFLEAGASEILAYLGSPFQVAVGTTHVTDRIIGGDPDSYRDYIDIEKVLMTNSAFFHLHQQMGYFSWLYVSLVCVFTGFVFETLASFGQTVFLLPCGAILYGSVELWRLDLFQQGIFIVWFVIGIGLPLFLFSVQRFARFLGSSLRTSPSS